MVNVQENRVEFRTCLVTDRHLCGGTAALVEKVAAAVRGRAGAVQLREKDLSGRALRALAQELLQICHAGGARLLINDRIDVALAVGADGVHLPADSFPVADARRLLGPDSLIGVSTHSLEEVLEAEREGADFAVFGPVFETPSKATQGPPQGLDRLGHVTASTSLPVFAIGGITAARVPAVRHAGAHGIAAIGAFLAAEDVEGAARVLVEAMNADGADTNERERGSVANERR
jgi:thiamine-phosphate pyrophosphorylase